MGRPVRVHSGSLLWSGEHWILGLRAEDSDMPSAWVSLFHTRYSPAGEGNTAHVVIPGAPGVNAICTGDPGAISTHFSSLAAVISAFFGAAAPIAKPAINPVDTNTPANTRFFIRIESQPPRAS